MKTKLFYFSTLYSFLSQNIFSTVKLFPLLWTAENGSVSSSQSTFHKHGRKCFQLVKWQLQKCLHTQRAQFSIVRVKIFLMDLWNRKDSNLYRSEAERCAVLHARMPVWGTPNSNPVQEQKTKCRTTQMSSKLFSIISHFHFPLGPICFHSIKSLEISSIIFPSKEENCKCKGFAKSHQIDSPPMGIDSHRSLVNQILEKWDSHLHLHLISFSNHILTDPL